MSESTVEFIQKSKISVKCNSATIVVPLNKFAQPIWGVVSL